MSTVNYISKSNIFFSCSEQEYRSIEDNVSEHALVHVYSGELKITNASGTIHLKEGETILFFKNMLAKFTKIPSKNAPFKSVAIGFTRPFLQDFFSKNKPKPKYKSRWEIQRIENHPLLESLFDSILPYYEIHGEFLPEQLTDLKLQEAMTILRSISPNVDDILSNFAEQGKVDLADFMLKNYSFNLPLERFAKLTGRSLATFKRDFQRIFNTPPQKWLISKRLEEASFLMKEKSKKPSEVYLEVGFENLSHFSTSFKRHFGYAPSFQNVSRTEK